MIFLAETLLARILAIGCGYEDANDLDASRLDPAFRLACGRLSESGADICCKRQSFRKERAV